jgi:peptidyl-prolyl cis-trans isomerase B (cyclophilin B)
MITAGATAQDTETTGWKALSTAVPSHHYPDRGRFRRAPEGDVSKRLAALTKAAETTKGSSAEPVTLYYLGNTHFALNQFKDAIRVFSDLLSRFPKHGLCVVAIGDKNSPSAVQLAIQDCKSEIEIRKVYTPRDLPVATIDPSARAIFHTSKGDFTMAFYTKAAPMTVANFKKLVKEGWFNNTYFHFVKAMQTVEAGCPNTRDGNRNRNDDGDGSPGYDLPIELSTAIHNAGAVSMKQLRASKRAHGSQFTICATPQPRMNNKQAVFAQVIDGLDIVKRVSQERADDHNRPYEHVCITGVEWTEAKVEDRNKIDGGQ